MAINYRRIMKRLDEIMQPIEKRLKDHLEKRLRAIQERVSLRREVSDVFRLFSDKAAAVYIAGYERIKSNKGATTEVWGDSLDGTKISKLHEIAKEIASQSWRPKTGKTVRIPNSGKSGGSRPLGMQDPYAKIVQSAVNILLETVWVKGAVLDKSVSFGWIPGLGQHDALNRIEKNFAGCDWAVEGDISQFFPSINHGMMLSLIRKELKDPKFERLIKHLLQGKMTDEDGVTRRTKVGIPQGSIMSPLLANIYLNELDKFVSTLEVDLCSEHNAKLNTSRLRGDYRKITREISKIKSQIKKSDSENRNSLVKTLRGLKTKLRKQPATDLTKRPMRIVYVRYADDFIIGVKGPRSLAETVKTRIMTFLKEKLNLTLHAEKTMITHLKTSAAKFLGHTIKVGTNSQESVKNTKIRFKNKKKGRSVKDVTKRTTGGHVVRIYMDWDKVLGKMVEKGLCNRTGQPTTRSGWAVLTEYEIVEKYSAIYNGYRSYYSGAKNTKKLGQLWYICLYSCMKTLADKGRGSVGKIYTKYYNSKAKTLSVTMKGGNNKEYVAKLRCGNILEGSRKWHLGKTLDLDRYFCGITNRTQKSKLGYLCCTICGEEKPLAMHHVKRLGKGFRANLKLVYKFIDHMTAVNRKQIAVCESCHHKIHTGEYNGRKLAELVKLEAQFRA